MGDGQAMQWAHRGTMRYCFIGSARPSQSAFGQQGDKRVDRRIDAFDLGEMSFHHCTRRQLSRADTARQFSGGHEANVGRGHGCFLASHGCYMRLGARAGMQYHGGLQLLPVTVL